MKYFYHVNLNERGSYFADVRDENDKTVLEIRAGNELGENETSIFQDGYMRHDRDMDGLAKYMRILGFHVESIEFMG